MPVYEYRCETHGKFEQFKPMPQCAVLECCPQCGVVARRIFSVAALKVVEKKRLQYGSESPGRILTRKETGGLDIFIPSMGMLEQEEVDDIALAAIDKEQTRVKRAKKQVQRQSQTIIQAYSDLARSTKRGHRARVLREAMKDQGDNLVTMKR